MVEPFELTKRNRKNIIPSSGYTPKTPLPNTSTLQNLQLACPNDVFFSMIEKLDSEVTDTASEDEDEESSLLFPATIVSPTPAPPPPSMNLSWSIYLSLIKKHMLQKFGIDTQFHGSKRNCLRNEQDLDMCVNYGRSIVLVALVAARPVMLLQKCVVNSQVNLLQLKNY